MASFTVEIDMDNAAFEDSPTGELSRILRKLAKEIADGTETDTVIKLRDINGNTVGTAIYDGGQ